MQPCEISCIVLVLTLAELMISLSLYTFIWSEYVYNRLNLSLVLLGAKEVLCYDLWPTLHSALTSLTCINVYNGLFNVINISFIIHLSNLFTNTLQFRGLGLLSFLCF